MGSMRMILGILTLSLAGCAPTLERGCAELAPYRRGTFPPGYHAPDWALEAESQSLLLLMSRQPLPTPHRGGPPVRVGIVAPVTHLDAGVRYPVVIDLTDAAEQERLMRKFRRVSDRLVRVELIGDGYQMPDVTDAYWVLLSEVTESTVEVNVGRYPRGGKAEGFLFQFARDGGQPVLKTIANYPAEWVALSAKP